MIQKAPQIVEFKIGAVRLGVTPTAGGCITRYASAHNDETFEWMRPVLPDTITAWVPGNTSAFPLIPFSNRIRNARFCFRGREIQLPQNFQPEPHAIHGHAWQAPWQISDIGRAQLTLEYRHPADQWPWAYVAHQIFDLTEERLRVRISVTNKASEPMPVGFGLHPYFVRTAKTRIQAEVGRMWQAGSDAMPTTLVSPPPLDFDSIGLNPDTTTLDNNFVGFGGCAVIEWPERQAQLRIDADPIFSCLVVYTPPDCDFFCVEPATNCIDGFNAADAGRTDTGMIVLAPNETAAGNITFTPVFL